MKIVVRVELITDWGDTNTIEVGRRTGCRGGLGELALALRQETYRPDPIRRVFKKPMIEVGRHARRRPETAGAEFRKGLPMVTER